MKRNTLGREVGKEDIVFCIFYCKKSENNKTPFVLAHLRDDNKIGFPGGHMEKHHNTLIEALKDEIRQEIDFNNLDENRLELLTTSINSRRHITVYSYEITFEEIKELQKNSIKAEHYLIENFGSILIPITRRYMNDLLSHNFSGSAKTELQALIYKKGLLR